MKALKGAMAEEVSGLAPQKTWIDAIRAELPEDGILVEELTQVSYASRLLFPVYGPRTYLTTGYQGTLGWGLPTALGAKVAMPGRAVVSVNGDGGFMFGANELATAVRHNIGVVALVFTDDAYGNVRRMQHDNYEGRVIASDLKNPDFVKLGASFGIRSTRAKTPKALRKEMAAAIKSGEPALIEIPVGTFPDPWRYFMRTKVRG
jgi:acetolactate synthase-1/2/3 large subunit